MLQPNSIHQLLPVLRRLSELPKWDPDVPELKQKREKMLRAYSEEWTKEFHCSQLSLAFEPELAVRAKGSPADLLNELPGLAHRAAIHAIDLQIDEEEDGPDRNLPLLAKLQALRVVRELRLSKASIRGEELAILLESSVWKKLECLDLHVGACEGDVISAISAAKLPATLRTLKTEGFHSGMGDDGLRALAHASWLPQLRRLDLRGQDLTDAGLAYFATIVQELSLLHLDLSNVAYSINDFSSEGLLALADRPWFQNLEHLGLAGCRVGHAIPEAFSHTHCLNSADLSNTGINLEELQAMVEMPSWPHLQELVLAGNPIGDEGAEILSKCTSLPGILDLRDCNISADGLDSLAKAPEVWALDLRWNPIGGDDWAAAIAMNQLPHASTLAVDARELSPGLISDLRRVYPRCDLAGLRKAA